MEKFRNLSGLPKPAKPYVEKYPAIPISAPSDRPKSKAPEPDHATPAEPGIEPKIEKNEPSKTENMNHGKEPPKIIIKPRITKKPSLAPKKKPPRGMDR